MHPTEISGLKVFVYFHDMISTFGLVTIDNFYYNYNNYIPHENDFLCVTFTTSLQNENKINHFTLKILNSAFSNLKNSSVLCAYEETWNRTNGQRFVMINNSTFSDNNGNPQLNMFNIVIEELYFRSKFNYTILINECSFTRNTNMKTLIVTGFWKTYHLHTRDT